MAVGTSFIATPAVGAGVGAAAGTVTSLVLEQFYTDSEPEFRKELGSDIAERWENTEDANTAMSHNAAVAAADAHRSPYADQVEEWTRMGTQDGFNDASTAGHHRAAGAAVGAEPHAASAADRNDQALPLSTLTAVPFFRPVWNVGKAIRQRSRSPSPR
ncbi:hypothetical protein P9869_04845 [Streptomyces ossamyceticus]|nr:hypothetical protein [Streptomyces ossamyceticus]